MPNYLWRIEHAQRYGKHRNTPFNLPKAAKIIAKATGLKETQTLKIVNEQQPFACDFTALNHYYNDLQDCGYKVVIVKEKPKFKDK